MTIGLGSLSLLQEIFLTQEWNQDLLHGKVDSLPAEPPRKPCRGVPGLKLRSCNNMFTVFFFFLTDIADFWKLVCRSS